MTTGTEISLAGQFVRLIPKSLLERVRKLFSIPAPFDVEFERGQVRSDDGTFELKSKIRFKKNYKSAACVIDWSRGQASGQVKAFDPQPRAFTKGVWEPLPTRPGRLEWHKYPVFFRCEVVLEGDWWTRKSVTWLIVVAITDGVMVLPLTEGDDLPPELVEKWNFWRPM